MKDTFIHKNETCRFFNFEVRVSLSPVPSFLINKAVLDSIHWDPRQRAASNSSCFSTCFEICATFLWKVRINEYKKNWSKCIMICWWAGTALETFLVIWRNDVELLVMAEKVKRRCQFFIRNISYYN